MVIALKGSSQNSFHLALPTLTPSPIRNIFFIAGSFVAGFFFFSQIKKLSSFQESFPKFQLKLARTL
jgi:hypothetical protein